MVVSISGFEFSVLVNDLDYIALQLLDVVVAVPDAACTGLVVEAVDAAVRAVEKLQFLSAPSIGDQLPALPGVTVLDGADRLRQAPTVRIVGEAHRGVDARNRADAFQPPPVDPRHLSIVVPCRRVADRVITDRVAVVSGQQILPAVGVAVGIAVSADQIIVSDYFTRRHLLSSSMQKPVFSSRNCTFNLLLCVNRIFAVPRGMISCSKTEIFSQYRLKPKEYKKSAFPGNKVP